MRRSFALALTALMLVFTLTACGGRNNDTVQDPTTPGNETTDTARPDNGDTSGPNGSTGSTNNGTGSTNNNPNSDTGDTMLENAGDAVGDVVDGVGDAVDDVLPDGNANTSQRSTGGVPYSDMMNKSR